MSATSTIVRRLFWLLAIALAGGAGYRWWREQQIPTRPDAPEWPPIDVPTPPAESSTDATQDATDDTAASDGTDATGDADATDEADDDAPVKAPESTGDATASVVNALVDAPEARSAAGEDAPWIEPDADGSCPLSHPIKANDNSGIFHVPGGRFYERTKAERCYVDADAALADGYRQAKS